MAWKGSKCSVAGCFNYKLQQGKSFYRFPKDKELCKQWVALAQKPGLDEMLKTRGPEYVCRSYCVCSDHFQEKDFRNKKSLSQGIWRGSVPSRLLPKPKQSGQDCERNGELGDVTSVHNDSAAYQLEKGFTAEQELTELKQHGFSSCTPEPRQVCNRITVKEEPELECDTISSEKHRPQVCDGVTVKEEPEPECDRNSSEKHRTQEPEYIEVKGEPFEVEEATDESSAEQDSLCFW